MINKYIIYFLCLFVFIVSNSCKQKERTEYYPNGVVKSKAQINNSKYNGYYKEFYEDGTIKTKMNFIEGIRQDTSYHYYEPSYKFSLSKIVWENDTAKYQKNYNSSNLLISEGSLLRYNFKIGKWKFYTLTGDLKEIQDFIDISNETYLNQNWILDSKGDTISGNYYNLKTGLIGENKETIRFHFHLASPFFSDSEAFVCIPKGENLSDDFSNEYKVKWDTIYNIAKRFSNQEKHTDRKYDIVFDIDRKDLGKKIFKGYLIEKSLKSDENLDFITRKIYFSLPVSTLLTSPDSARMTNR